MKFSYWVLSGVFVSSFASAMPAPERPVLRATLSPTGHGGPAFPRATTLTMNRRLGAEAATSFTLVEDTGIRCFRAPCPSTKETKFVVTGMHASFHHGDSTRYEAVEQLVNIPPNVRIVPRKLEVTESDMELVAPGGNGFFHRTMWDVEVTRFQRPSQTYSGVATPVVRILPAPIPADGLED